MYLDEPTVGVGARSKNYLLETIRKINRERQTTIIYTSHYMDEIEQVADETAVIDGGKIILYDSKQSVLTSIDSATVNVEELGEAAARDLPHIEGIEMGKDRIIVNRDGHFNETKIWIGSLPSSRPGGQGQGHGLRQENYRGTFFQPDQRQAARQKRGVAPPGMIKILYILKKEFLLIGNSHDCSQSQRGIQGALSDEV